MKSLKPLETFIIIIIYIFFHYFGHTNNYDTLLHLQFITITSNYRLLNLPYIETGFCYRFQK